VYDTAKNLEDLPNTLGTLVQTLHGNSGHQPVNPLQHADLVKTEAAKGERERCQQHHIKAPHKSKAQETNQRHRTLAMPCLLL